MLMPRASLLGHRRYVYSVAFSPDGGLLCTCGYDHTVRVSRLADGAPLHTLHGHGSWVLAVACSGTAPIAASGGAGDNRVRVWDLCTLGRKRSGHRDRDGDNRVRVWDLCTGALTATLPAHGRHIEHLAFSPDGTLRASSSGDGTVRLWSRVGAG